MGFIFDLDGTLLDSLEDLKNSLNAVLKRHGLKEHSSSDYKNFVGNGMQVLVERAIPKDYPKADEVLSEVLVEYGERYYEESRPYAGILPMLKTLNEKNIPISICTNKKQEYTDEIIKRFFSDIEFVKVVGDQFDGLHKPNPHYPLIIAKEMEVETTDIYFVGDSDVDMQTSINAEMKGVGVSWGFRTVEELKNSGAITIIYKPEDIYKLI
ncbi:MAG: HAD family hydrolase [Erysipelothrix sp.]|nr:HAD family hydrolase [Erysipelothrix sp.]